MICEAGDFSFVHKLRDDDTRHAYKCQKCGHIQILPLPTAEEDYAFYQSGKMYERIFKNPKENDNKRKLAERLKAFAEYPAKKFMQYLQKDWKILEIGSAYGWIVQYLQEYGYDIDGVEISDDYRDIYHDRTGKELLSFNFLTDEPDTLARYEYYDCICAFHTIEHINSPIEFIRKAVKLLKPGGMVYFEVPNNDDFMLSLSEKYAEHSYRRGHVSYYIPHTLKILLEKCGLNNVNIIGNHMFSPENASQWLRYSKPFHEYHQIDLPEPLQWLNKIYKDRIESDLTSYSIIGIAIKDI
jgi:2-polyprenyl-3-methyl-5-hydroxy-6-metoxy-1,4-benzoquinol methylase